MRNENKMFSAEPEEVISQTIHPAEMITQFDLAVAINAVCQQTIEPTREGKVPKRIFNKIRPLLKGKPRMDYDAQDLYLEILLSILQVQTIIQLTPSLIPNGKDAYEPASELAWWQQQNAVQQTCYLLTLWCAHNGWSEIVGVNFSPWDTYYWQPIQGRDQLVELLKSYTPGRWYRISSLLDDLWHKAPFAMRPQLTQMSLKKKAQKELHERWLTCDGEIYIGMIYVTLYELGIVSLGYDGTEDSTDNQPRNPDAFMITELGATVFSLIDQPPTTYVPPENNTRTLIVQPNFELMLLEPDFPTLYKILPFSQVQQIGVASRLTLTRASVLHAVERGLKLDSMLTTLEEHSQKELPQNVIYTLKDWVKDYKEIVISQVYLLEVDNEESADRLCASPKLQKSLQGFHLRKLAPCILAIDGNINLLELKRLLEKEGIAVRISGDFSASLKSTASTYGMTR
jgi:hypothetical protein